MSEPIYKISGEKLNPEVFDELKCSASYVHIERMSDGHVWMMIQLPNGDSIDLNFTTSRFSNKVNVQDWEFAKPTNKDTPND